MVTQQITENSDLKAIYDRRHGLWQGLQLEVIHTLQYSLHDARFKIHSLTGRVKTLDSIEGKLQRKFITSASQLDIDESITDSPQFGLDDIVGVRVVCMFLNQIDEVAALIKRTFNITNEDRKISTSDATSFGYMSDHFICQLKDEFKGTRYDDIKDIPFEIQVRTIAMDAWASVSHHLDYKSDASVPAELRKDFYALSGLFYVADTHFQMFYKQVEEFRKKLERESHQDLLSSTDELNADTLAAYLRTRFPERRETDMDSVSEFLNELIEHNYKKLRQVEDAIARGELAMVREEKDNPPTLKGSTQITQYNQIGAARISISQVDSSYKEYIKSKALRQYTKKHGATDKIASLKI
jgi:putative GTP pyrophosphokinase